MTITGESRRSRRLVFEMAKRPDLQGMRAVAVLTVFADHLFGWPSGGFVGVDMFFVLSGFFITGLLLKERSETGELSFSNFYTRRVKRILPSALLVLIVTVIAAHYLFPAARAKDTLLDALYAAVFAANVRFQAVGADYFQQALPPSPIQHYWSLSIEEQFYFVWPILLLALFAVTRRLYRKGHLWARHGGLLLGMGVVVIGSFSWAMHQSVADPNAAYFSTFTRVWELGIGALLAIAGPWLARLPEHTRPALAYLGLAGIVASLFLINSTVTFPAPWAALPVASTALVIASFHGGEVRAVPMLTNPVARWFGDTSYTLYLWHWPVIILLEAVIVPGPVFVVAALTLAFGLTAVTYHFYENPIRTSGWLTTIPKGRRRDLRGRPKPPLLTPSRWALIGGIAAGLIVVWIVSFGYNAQIDTARQEIAAADRGPQIDLSPEEKADPCFGAAAMVTAGCVLWNPDKPVLPDVDQLRADSQSAFDCFREKGQQLKSCTYGYNGPDATRIAIAGDSHAAAILPGIWPSLDANKWQLTTFTGEGCRLDGPSDECKSTFNEMKDKIAADRYDILILTGARKYGGNFPTLLGTLEPITAAGTRIVFISDTPTVGDDVMACLTRASTGIGDFGDCGTSRADGLAQPDPMVAAAERVPGSTLIDLTPLYCNQDRCPAVIGNVVAYFDAGAHLTGTFAKSMAPAIQDGLRRAVAP